MKVFIDPGHGGADSGASGNGIREKNIVLDIGKKLQSKLEKYPDIQVRLSRTTDQYVTLTQRANNANAWNADLFISIHINAGGGTGFESYIFNGNVSSRTKDAQTMIHEEIIGQIGVVDRGKKTANFAVLRQTNMPAILTEMLFIDAKADADKLRDSQFINKAVTGYELGILRFFGLERSSAEGGRPKPTKSDLFIRQVQQFVVDYGYNITIDGIAGPQTKQGLIKVLQAELNKQFGKGLIIDGILGPKTSAALVTVRKGARGNITKVLQALLYINGFNPGPFDGIFGEQTYKAVQDYQRSNKLSVDGIPGRVTWTALLK